MHFKTKFISLFLSGVLACTMMQGSLLASQVESDTSSIDEVRLNNEDIILKFNDIHETDWFYEAVNYAVRNKLLQGTSKDEFAPNEIMTRAMLVTVIYRMENSPQASNNIGFKDVPQESYYKDAVSWASTNNIITGYSNIEFAPNDVVTREQMVTILYNYAKYKSYKVDNATQESNFKDISDVSIYAKDAVNWAISNKYITGLENNMLMPKGSITRAQVAAILQRFCTDNEPEETPKTEDIKLKSYKVTFDFGYDNKQEIVEVEEGKKLNLKSHRQGQDINLMAGT